MLPLLEKRTWNCTNALLVPRIWNDDLVDLLSVSIVRRTVGRSQSHLDYHPTLISVCTSTTTPPPFLKPMLDRRTTLCLACSSSLPPNVEDSELFMTNCCGRPICPRCLETNPRLARYNPCLACLAGVGVIQASSSATNRTGRKPGSDGSGAQSQRVENLDGGVRDQDLFVLADGDEDSDSDDDMSVDGEKDGRFPRSAAPPPPDVIHITSPLPKTPPPPSVTTTMEEPQITTITSSEDEQSPKPDVPVVYQLRRGDTLMGIALRFRLDVCFMHGSHSPNSF